MRTSIYNLSTLIGNMIKDRIFLATWDVDKEIATIAEKAMKYSDKTGKPLNECVSSMIDAMEKGYIIPKVHDYDDYTRGIIAGKKLGSVINDTTGDAPFDEVEAIWSARYNDYMNAENKNELYVAIINNVKRKYEYKRMGLITIQELTKKLLNLMDEGYKDKYIVLNNTNFTGFKGEATTEIAPECNIPNTVNKDDLIMVW